MRDTTRMEQNAVPAKPPAGSLARDLDQHLDHVLASPRDAAPLELIVARPGPGERSILDEAVLDEANGLVGDGWLARGSRSTPDRSANPAAQLTLMSTRVLAAIEPDRSRWPLAGDQLHLDLDLSAENLPVGTRLTVGDGRARGDRAAAHRLRPVQRPVRGRCPALDQHPDRAGRTGCAECTCGSSTGGTVRLGDIVRKA